MVLVFAGLYPILFSVCFAFVFCAVIYTDKVTYKMFLFANLF